MKRYLRAGAAVGLIGGVLFGLRDAVLTHRTYSFLITGWLDAVSVYVYSIGVYAVIACVAMVVGSVVLALVLERTGRANDSRAAARWTGGMFLSVVLFIVIAAWTQERWVLKSLLHPVTLLPYASVVALSMLLGGLLAKWIWPSSHGDGARAGRWRLVSGVAGLWIAITAPILIGPKAPIVIHGGPSGESETSRLAHAQNPPNVLWVVVDTLRADHVTCYGYEGDTTPTIDRLAGEGVIYDNAYATSPWTLPSHASMFTGMYSSTHGARAEHRYLSSGLETVAEVLRRADYQTVGFSNNPNIGPQTNLIQGFEYFVQSFFLGGQNLEHPRDGLLFNRILNRALRGRWRNPSHAAGVTNQAVRSWLTNHHRSDQPFFIFVHYMEPHAPYVPPAGYSEHELDDLSRDAREIALSPYHYMARDVDLSDEEFAKIRALYDGEIRYVDEKLSELLEAFRVRGILDETLIIVTSDHGENFGEHGLTGHQFCLYDTLLRVPMVVRYPGDAARGVRSNAPVQITDIFPTILDVAQIEWEGRDALQGVSLLRAEDTDVRSIMAEYGVFGSKLEQLVRINWAADYSPYARKLTSLQLGSLKYIQASDEANELYRTDEDPRELNNLVTELPEETDALRISLEHWLRTNGSSAVDSSRPTVEADDETVKKLKALGYL